MQRIYIYPGIDVAKIAANFQGNVQFVVRGETPDKDVTQFVYIDGVGLFERVQA